MFQINPEYQRQFTNALIHLEKSRTLQDRVERVFQDKYAKISDAMEAFSLLQDEIIARLQKSDQDEVATALKDAVATIGESTLCTRMEEHPKQVRSSSKLSQDTQEVEEARLITNVFDQLLEIGPLRFEATYNKRAEYYINAREVVIEILKTEQEGNEQTVSKARDYVLKQLDEEQAVVNLFFANHSPITRKAFYLFCCMTRKYINSKTNLENTWKSFICNESTLAQAYDVFQALVHKHEMIELEIPLFEGENAIAYDREAFLKSKIKKLFTSLRETVSEKYALLLINNIEKDAEKLFEVAKKPFLDATCLVTGNIGDQAVERYREWFLFQANLREAMEKVDQETKERLSLLVLQTYGRCAPIDAQCAESLQIQTSPLYEYDKETTRSEYFRSSTNPLLGHVNRLFEEKFQLRSIPTWGQVIGSSYKLRPNIEAHLVNGPLACEVLVRENSDLGLNPRVDSYEKFVTLADMAIELHSQKALLGRFFIDYSELADGSDPTKIPDILGKFNEILYERISASSVPSGSMEQRNLDCTFDEIVAHFAAIALVQWKDQQILLLSTLTSIFYWTGMSIPEILAHSGCLLSQDQARLAWLKIENNPELLLRKEGVPTATFATKGMGIPVVCTTFSEFIKQPVVVQFADLSRNSDVPYLQIHPQALYLLLKGLEQVKVDERFAEKNCTELLQITYFRMLNAMQEAIFRKDSLVNFLNSVELIHQEIQLILAIVQPYDDREYATSVTKNLTEGPTPLIPTQLGIAPKVHLKNSGMHAIMSAVSAVEAQKGTQHLAVCLLHGSYFETSLVLPKVQAYKTSTLIGDVFSGKGLGGAFIEDPTEKFDVFVGEFHHNICPSFFVYRIEKICEQIKAMESKGLIAEQFTVILDITMDLEHSTEIAALLRDETISTLIKDGKMNLVLVRSAQKFDMFGIDNYSGGVSIVLNNTQKFAAFNARMAHPRDQLRGLSYQGLTHLQKHAHVLIEDYRKAIMENTSYLYSKLPKEMKVSEQGIDLSQLLQVRYKDVDPSLLSRPRNKDLNPILIAQIQDNRMVYLHIILSEIDLSYAVTNKLNHMVELSHLPITRRESWGFSMSNIVAIPSAAIIRFGVGLENKKTLDAYARFFNDIQKVIISAKGRDDIDVVQAIEKIAIPSF